MREKLPPVKCTPWCADGTGHTDAVFPEDQTCWGYDRYVDLSLAEVMLDSQGAWYAGLGACAHRSAKTMQSSVYVHLRDITLRRGDEPVDSSIRLTANEARAFASALVVAADDLDSAN